MNKRLTRVLSLIMVLAMFLSVSVPAFALEDGWDREIKVIGDNGGFAGDDANTADDGEPDEGWDREISAGEIRPFDAEPDNDDPDPKMELFTENEELGYSVTVEAPMGALPTLAELRAEPVEIENIIDAVGEVVEGEPNVLVALDISFWLGEDEIEPEEPVQVIISAPELEGRKNLTLVHLPEEDEPEAIELIDEGDLAFELGTNEICFQSKDFSVYAVVEDGSTDPEARITVNFFNPNESTTDPIVTVYVKNADELLAEGQEKQTGHSYINDIVYDPGVGETLASGLLFRGWSLDVSRVANRPEGTYVGNNYNSDTVGMTIPELRQLLADLIITEGDVLNVYAIIFKVYHVTYENAGVTVASDVVTMSVNDATADYTIEHSFSTTQQDEHFEGWYVIEGESNISEAKYNGEDITLEEGQDHKLYPMGATMKIAGNVKFGTDVAKGHWLVFDENNYGATYNAPVFVEQNENTAPPALEMTCPGYSFGGWYKLKTGETITTADKDANGYVNLSRAETLAKFEPFTFGGTINERTELFAKWNVAETTKVTVIVWQQSVSDDKNAADDDKTYDFAFSKEIEGVTPKTAITALDLSEYQGLAGNRKYTVGDKDYSFYGFKYNDTKGAVGKYTVKNDDNADSVNPNGTTVVNLYYDRELVTLTFLIPDYRTVSSPDWNSGTTYYYKSGSNYYEVSRVASGGGWGGTSYTYYYYTPFTGTKNNNTTYYLKYNGAWYAYSRYNTYYGYQWLFEYEGEYYTWGGTIYTRNTISNGGSRTYYEQYLKERNSFTGLYGQKLTKYNYTWPTDYRWYNYDYLSETGTTFTSVMDMFGASNNDNPSDEFQSNFYGYVTTYNTNVYHFLQNVDGTYSNTATYTIPTVVGNGMVFRSFQGFTASEFRIKLPTGVNTYTIGTSYVNTNEDGEGLPNDNGVYEMNDSQVKTTTTGWTEWLPYPTAVEYEDNDRHETDRWAVTEGGIEFRYTRNKYDLTYMVGRFVDRDNKALTPLLTGELKTVEDIPFESSLASYSKTGANYYDPDKATPQTGFVFAGWYVDETCTTEALFDGTMPLNGVAVYGKWQQVEYRVFLHSNALINGERDQALDWGDDSQSMNFRIAYGNKVSIPTGRREASGYVFGGWYTDEALTHAYNADTKLTDSTVPATPAYDKTKDWTDGENDVEMDKWGLIPDGVQGINKDVNRTWITRKLDLYARWSKVLPGAEGIKIVYDAREADENGGTNAPTDDLLYQDNIYAIAQAASKAKKADMQFAYWVLQRWDTTQNKFVDVAGTHYYPGESFPVNADNARDVDNGDSTHTYIIQLRAEYVNKDAPLPTYITWYSNVYDAAGNLIPNAQQKTTAVAPTTTDTGATYTALTFDAEKGYGYTRTNVSINAPIEIPAPTTYQMEGYTFLGWGRIDKTQSGTKDASGVTDPADLDESKLFLKWVPTRDGEGGSYQAKDKNGNWVDVSKVAADENNPYQDLYAVWSGNFYVYHTGVAGGAIETVAIKRDNKTYDLTQHLGGAGVNRAGEAPDVLYGGYYLKGGLTTPTELVDGQWPAYDGTNWTFSNPEMTDLGTQIKPVGGETYYVKEVPADNYLIPYLHYTFYTESKKIGTAWLISDTDDYYYLETGFVITHLDGSKEYIASMVTKLTVKCSTGGKTEVLEPTKVFTADHGEGNNYTSPAGGYLIYNKIINGGTVNLKDGDKVQQYWVTPDGLRVTSKWYRIYQGLEGEYTSITKTDAAEASVIQVHNAADHA